MDFQLTDTHILRPGLFHAVCCPVQMMVLAINGNPILSRYTAILISGNYSRIVNGIKIPADNLTIQRPFTVHQLLTVLHEAHQTVIIVEHDSSSYGDAGEVRRVIPETMRQISRESLFILYSPSMDKDFSYLASAADHLFVCDEGSIEYQPKVKQYKQRTLC